MPYEREPRPSEETGTERRGHGSGVPASPLADSHELDLRSAEEEDGDPQSTADQLASLYEEINLTKVRTLSTGEERVSHLL